MANKKIIEAKDLSGLFIDHDPKRGCVYYDVFRKKGYILTNADAKKYNLYTLALPLSIMAGYLLALFGVSTWICVAFAIVAYLGFRIMFRFKFLYNLPEIPNYTRKNKDNILVSYAKQYGTIRLAVLTVLLAAISVVTVLNAKVAKFEGFNLYMNYAVAVIVGIVSILSLIATIISRKYKE